MEERTPVRRLLKSSMRDDGGLDYRGCGRGNKESIKDLV